MAKPTISRRMFTATLSAAAAGSTAAQQTAAPTERERTTDSELASALMRLGHRVNTLARFEVPFDTEPAFMFHP